MRLYFSTPRDGTMDTVLAEAEIHFDADSPLAGMKLVGFAIRKGDPEKGGDLFVTGPSRPFGAGTERKYFDYLRPADGYDSTEGKKRLSGMRRWILAEYKKWAATRGSK